MKPLTFQKKMLSWFDACGRKTLPWQKEISPYRVWISEIMLQQTQVATVIPYFERFMALFPDLQTLSEAHLDEVLHAWAGLGYYTRARSLHRAAIQIQTQHDGKFPDSLEALIDLPGIGRSTAGAILSIAFQKRAPILDGNVKRVLTRFYGIEDYSGLPAVAERLWEYAEKLTPDQRVHHYTQAMMDLGAMVCVRSNPKCALCPLHKQCVAFLEKKTASIPAKKPSKILPEKKTWMLLIQNENEELLFIQRPPTGIWGGLWTLPECEPATDLKAYCKQIGFSLKRYEELTSFSHTFSHFRLQITALILTVKNNPASLRNNSPYHWLNAKEPLGKGIPAPVKKVLCVWKNQLEIAYNTV